MTNGVEDAEKSEPSMTVIFTCVPAGQAIVHDVCVELVVDELVSCPESKLTSYGGVPPCHVTRVVAHSVGSVGVFTDNVP